jgi:hypothetical protein
VSTARGESQLHERELVARIQALEAGMEKAAAVAIEQAERRAVEIVRVQVRAGTPSSSLHVPTGS